MNQPDLLYKRTSTGLIQVWCQQFNEAGDGFRTVSGILNGKMVASEWTICTPKNVGRSNETSPQAQAQLEVEANYKKKLEQGGYHKNTQSIDEAKYFSPMLAKNYSDYPPTEDDFANRLVYSQPKLDGIRAIIDYSGVWSRKGKRIFTADHIREALNPHFAKNPELIFDGELYSHALKDDFNRIVSLVKKTKPTAEDLDESRRKVEYWIYDLPSHSGVFGDRAEALLRLLTDNLSEPPSRNGIVWVDTEMVPSLSRLNDKYAYFLLMGFEGQIVRMNTAPYENKRTKQLLKRKEWADSEFEVIRVEEGLGNRSGMAAAVRFRAKNGEECGAGIKFPVPVLRQIWEKADSLVGSLITVEYFPQLTPGGAPRFGRVTKFHSPELSGLSNEKNERSDT